MMKLFLIKLTIFFTIGSALFTGWLYYWGIVGEIDGPKFDQILNSTLPSQKRRLADALNYYYDNDLIKRYTTAYIFKCKPTNKSIKKQFNWFHRNIFGALTTQMPSYHQIVIESMKTKIDAEQIPVNASTFELELNLKQLLGGNTPYMTKKDAIGTIISITTITIKIFIAGLNPYAGLALSAIELAQASMSDSGKIIPAIICFSNIRNENFSYSFLLTLGLSVFIFLPFKKKKQSKKKNK